MTGESFITQDDGNPEPLDYEVDTDITKHVAEHAGMQLAYRREQQSDDITEYNIWVPGFFGIHSAYNQLRHEATLLDPHAGNISMHAPRKHDLWHSLSPQNSLHPSLMLSKAVWGIIKDTAEDTGVQKFNLIGHSMGGPAVVNAATYIQRNKDGSLLNSVTLNASAGVTNHNIATLAPRAARLLTDEIRSNWPELSKRVGGHDRAVATRELIRYMFHRQTFLEMLAVSNCNILDKIATLSETVPTAGLFFPSDPLFDVDRAERNLSSRVHAFEVMQTPETAGHVAPQLYPAEVAAKNLAVRQSFGQTQAA